MMNTTISVKFATGGFLLLTILFCSAPFSIAGKISNPVSVNTHITPDTFTLGDIATYTITVQHDLDIHPAAPDIEPPTGLEFIDLTDSDRNELKLVSMTM